MPDLKYYQDLMTEMLRDDKDRDIQFRKYRDARNLEYNLPAKLEELQGIHKVTNTDPHDAIEASARVLTGKPPRVTLTPLASDQDNRQRANEIERILDWQLKSVNRRRPEPVQADMLKSALTYSCIAAQVIDLDWQVQQFEKLEQDATRWKKLRRYSRFVVPTYSPLDVHVLYSSYMPEVVAVYQRRSPRSIFMDYPWAKQLEGMLDSTEPLNYAEVWDNENRVIWCSTKENTDDQVVLLQPTAHELDFFPWIAMMGGSTLESNPKHAYHGLLYQAITSGKWEDANILSTMMVTEAIWNFGSNKYAEEGQNPSDEVADITSWNESRVAKVPIGDTLKPLPPNYLDPALQQLVQMFSEGMRDNRVLQGESGAGEAFASLNLRVMTAVGQLRPWRELTERALAEMFTQMMLWVAHTDIALQGVDVGERNSGDVYTLQPDEVPEEIYVDVELVPELPTNKQAQANTAIMLKQAGLIDDETALEEMGYSDPLLIEERLMLDELTSFYLQQEMEGFIEQKAMELHEQMMQEQEDEAQAAMQQEQAMGQGQMMAPPMGGMPPAMMEPGLTREMATGEDMSGIPLEDEFE